ncbi:phage baseplate plug family protein [Candidatus Arsenophonus triatominarum]|uniref:phage baseplate plug family protein n=1 Tax=Candidatus Arsenophonus triatominarum TaxID=57911 RepID=UPI00316AD067
MEKNQRRRIVSTIMLSPVKSQRINLTLNGQECTLRLTQHESALYLDLTVKGIPVVQGVPCLHGTRLVRYAWLGFTGDLFFVDTQGQEDPRWHGLGSRWFLFYEDGNVQQKNA